MTALIELYANNAHSVLAGSITSSSATLSVSPGTGSNFPVPVPGVSFFRLVLTGAASPNTVEEICYVTQVSGDTFTVLRGQEGTTAVAWSVNDLAYNAVTAGTLEQFMQNYYGADTSASNNYVIANAVAAASYTTGMVASFSSAYSNTTTTPTLNVNGLGAKTIKNADGTALGIGQIESAVVQVCYYNGSDNSWRLQTPSYGQVIANLGYVPVNKGGDTMTGALTNPYGYYGTLYGDWASMPSGTTTVFYQASAPSGWTQIVNTAVNDSALRVVSGSGGGSTAGNNFSSTFVSQTVTGSVTISAITGTIGGTSLTVSQLPSHNHAVNDGGHSHYTIHYAYTQGGPNGPCDGSVNGPVGNFGTNTAFTGITIGSTGGGATHTHSLTMNAATGSFSGNSIPMNVKYIDLIVCTKS